MDKAQALYAFWSGYDLPAYDETNAPEDAPFPRITYETATDSFGGEVALSAALWYYSTSWEAISKKSAEIAADIGMGGKMLKTNDGAIWVKRGTPFAQRVAETNDSLRRIVMNITAEFFTEN